MCYIVPAEHSGELHVPAVQRVAGHFLDIHVQEGAGDEEQNVRRDSRAVPSRQRQVSDYTILSTICPLLFLTHKHNYRTTHMHFNRAQRKPTRE